MSGVRPPAVAGRWYPGHPLELGAAVDALVAAAGRHASGEQDSPAPGRIRALVVPHAGLPYSGGVGAVAYAALRSAPYRSVVLVGPSHFIPFHGVSIWPSGAWDTPLGAIAVDETLAAALALESPLIAERPAAHAREHSLEMQLPFVARLMAGVPIVPMVLGDQGRKTVDALGGALARAILAAERRAGLDNVPDGSDVPSVLLIASSDLSHYEDARTALALDQVVMDHVDACDPEGLMTALERNARHACGGGAMVAILQAARALGARHARVLHYADSGDVSGDKTSVVGYMAAAIW